MSVCGKGSKRPQRCWEKKITCIISNERGMYCLKQETVGETEEVYGRENL